MNRIQIVLRLFIAGSLGALVALEAGKFVSDHPVALLIWAIIGGFVGFILVGPQAFFAELKKQISEAMEKYRKEKQNKWIRKQLRRRRLNNPLFARIYSLKRTSCILECIGMIFVFTWIAVFITCMVIVGGSKHEQSFFYCWFWVEILACTICVMIGTLEYSDINATPYLKEKIPEIPHLEKSLAKEVSKKKSDVVYALFTPVVLLALILMVLYLYIRLLVLNIGFLGRSLLLIIAKTCQLVATPNRWWAAVGAIVGFMVGWNSGKSETVAMLVGGFAGNCIFVVSTFLLKILPDPNSPWPGHVPL